MNPLLPYNAFITHMAAQPTLPSFYWQVYSYEQRIKEICIRLQRCILYNDYTVENVNQLIDLVNNLSTRVDELNDQIQDVNKRLLEEIERATAAEEEITNNLNAEIERAKAAEAELSTRISTVSDNLATETERAKQAEAALDAKIEAETNRATQKENELQAAIDEIQPPNALTPTHVEHVPTAGNESYVWGEQATGRTSSITIGFSANAGDTSVAIGGSSYAADANGESRAVAVGESSHADEGGTSVGHNSSAGEYSVAIGDSAEANVDGVGAGRGAVAIGSGSIASQDMTVSVGNSTLRRRIIRVDTPTQNDDAATKEYVDNAVGSVSGGMEFPDYATYKTLSISEGEGANIKDVTPDVDGYTLLWCATAVSQETDRAVYVSVPSGPSWTNIAKLPVAPNAENTTGALGTPIPVKSGTTLRISLPATVTLLAVRHFYKA